ncbi:SAV_2336 N-terminal domain-related protein [Streptomyces sp. NPDC059467]|uniref:SAV_2336 N-terminal domain-related protein n=1 Tax=Streptomyces sp. NPDC059467 TaxID=3346844 RepID=UPI00367BB69A
MPGGGARLAEALRVLSATGHELDADQVLDVLWLARRLPAGAASALNIPAPAGHPSVEEPPAPGTDRPEPDVPAPDPGDPGLPDLTSPSLYAAARQTPTAVPDIRTRRGPEPGRAMPVRVPEDKALAAELELGRALRPLRRRRASPHRLEIDEEHTAAELAETRLPDVVQRPVQERWLHLMLLVDDGLSMLLWHRLGAELRTLLERLGAFATTRVLGLDTRDAHQPRLHARPFGPDSAPVPLSAVVDPSGHTLVLVVSDGMGAAWRSGALHRLLTGWASRGPTALLHTLPPDLWDGSGIHAERWQVTTRRIGGANTSWDIADPVLPADLAAFNGAPVPVLEPTPGSLRDWSRLLASPGTTCSLPLLARPGRTPGSGTVPGPVDPQHFRDAATPEAYRLAAHLAAVSPLTVPVMRLVQTAVPWQARTSHLAEVFLGGLLRPHPAPVPGPLHAKHQVFDFTDSSRLVLLDAVPQAELLRTSQRIGRRLEQLVGNSPDFPAWLAHPEGPAQLPGTHRPFTSIERRLLSRFGVSFDRETAGLDVGPDQGGGGDGWGPLTEDDPRSLGPYRLLRRRRLRRTVEYDGVDAQGVRAMVRTPRPGPAGDQAHTLEAEALHRLGGKYAPTLLGHGLHDDPPWVAAAPVVETGTATPSPPLRLAEIFNTAHAEGHAPFDKITALVVGWHLASAVALCHLHGIVPGDLNAENFFVLRRSVVLGELSDCAVDGRYPGAGIPPAVEDNVRALGELLQLVSSKPGWELPGRPEGMHLWQGDTWNQLRGLVLRCLEPDPAARPAAGDIADTLARYIAQSRVEDTVPPPSPTPAHPTERIPLTEPRPAPAAELPFRLPRFGIARQEAEARIARLRAPLRHGRRLTLVGAHSYSGRSTTTMVLGSLLAAVRGDPVLALDGASHEGALADFLTDRNPATVRDLAGLPVDSPYQAVRALTTALPSGLQVAAHPQGHVSPNFVHAQAYEHILTRTEPYYSYVLTDWAPQQLGASADPVLDLTDRLVLCCGISDFALAYAARMLAGLRDARRWRLAEEALVVVTEVEGPTARRVPAGLARRLGVMPDHVVAVPFDKYLSAGRFRELARVRPQTLAAFLDLAERA